MYTSHMLLKKAKGGQLDEAELNAFISELCAGKISTAQIGAFLMAVFIKGMAQEEIASLTACMMRHSDHFQWNDKPWSNLVVDKHSTGGVGDKTSHLLVPMVVACGYKVPMISGRGLGITGGTIDKLESIKGYSASHSEARLREVMDDAGCFIVGQTENLVPSDRQLYKYRDVTGTVASIPLITSSILSKKLCEGLRGLVMDIKVGSGAVLKNPAEVEELAKTLVSVGSKLNLKVVSVLSRMDEPLGDCIGNALEMAEVFSILAGEPLRGQMGDLILTLGENMVSTVSSRADITVMRRELLESLTSRKAQQAMKRMLVCQGVAEDLATKLCSDPPKGCEDIIEYYVNLMDNCSTGKTEIKSTKAGFVADLNAGIIAETVWRLGAGRDKPDQPIDHSVGIRLRKHVGDKIYADETWCSVYHKDKTLNKDLMELVQNGLVVSESLTQQNNVIFKIIK